MNSQLKHRLVGACVLLALAAIILPDVLDGEKVSRQQDFAVIPLQPQLPAPEFKLEQPIEQLQATSASAEPELAEVPHNEPDSATDLPQSQTPAATNPSDRQLPQFSDSGWVLQLGVFRNATNVNGLIEKLREAGYPAFSKPKQAVQGKPTWVYVGPNLDKKKLTSMEPDVKRLTGLNGQIFPYNPQSQ
ncbi:SPOR domain-containing protein [Neiella marina]|uniref:SPOR domain-containing protein n=1 Tax=Neiella holothuriorum TaxID=2870530 RepID=A0ABS7EDI1_9GAMM|nr:SPOR domain-containing protein [Neiella holothuriorum]MBW8190404.1 SPOR domain-containing protein [Neiella holothuriorum]